MTPEKLAEYDKIQKGFADRVIKMIEEESAHRREIEKLHLEDMRTDRAAQRELAKRGQTFGLLIGLATIIAGPITAGTGHELAGGFIGGGGVIGLVAVFVVERLKPFKYEDPVPSQSKR